MFKNLITIGIRTILKGKIYSAINILSLTIGITCSVFVLLFILDELSYDRYHKNADDIYRVVSYLNYPDHTTSWAVAQIPLAEELRENYPEVSNVVRFFDIPRALYRVNDKQFYEDCFFLTDSTVFDMFSYEFIAGDKNTALDMPLSIVITEKIARKYFGDVDPLGQSIQNLQNEEFKVTGVIKDIPHNSHFRFDGLISRNTRPRLQGSWSGWGVFTYIQLPPAYNLATMNQNLDNIVKQRVMPSLGQNAFTLKYELQPIKDIHLYSKMEGELESSGNISYIYIFGAIAIFMIIIANINYMNLATARSANRAKEVGVRKVMGSQRVQLIYQFIIESVIITLAALLVSIGLIYTLLPAFNSLAGKEILFNQIFQKEIIFSLISVGVFTGIVGGSYPAFYLSAFSPANVLKGKNTRKGGGLMLRKCLVVVQFTISIFMLCSTLIVFDQLKFLSNNNLGFEKDQVIRIPVSRELLRKSETLISKLKQEKGVAKVSAASSIPGQRIGKWSLKAEDNEGKLEEFEVPTFTAHNDFVSTLGMQIVKGRDFANDHLSDTSSVVLVNETMVKRRGWDDPIGKRFVCEGCAGNNTNIVWTVVGVVKDYHQTSLYNLIDPVMMILGNNNRNVLARIEAGNTQETLINLEKVWKEIYPDYPFEYSFIQQDINAQYGSDESRSQIFTTFSILTVIIACLGLLGLVAFSTEQRAKEMGIRKVLGANMNSLIRLLSLDFIVLVIFGMILAFPIAWYFANGWLQSFAYRINLSEEWMTFAISGILAIAITMLTVGYHVLRSALINPVNLLRDE